MVSGFVVDHPGFMLCSSVVSRKASFSAEPRRRGSAAVSVRRRTVTAHSECDLWGEGCSHGPKEKTSGVQALPLTTEHNRARTNVNGNGHSHEHEDHCNGNHQHAAQGSDVAAERVWNLNRVLQLAEDMRDDLRIAAVCTACLMMGFGLHLAAAPPLFVQGVIGVVAVLSGVPNLIAALQSFVKLRCDVDVLMTMAALASFFSGAFLEGALLLVLFTLSHAAEHSITDKAKGDLDAIRALSPEVALVVSPKDPRSVNEVPVEQVRVGDLVLVKSSEILPCDGKVHGGKAYVSLAHITGESTPRAVGPGDEIPAGACPLDGSITVQVQRTGAESALSRIIRLVTEARRNRPRLQSFIDRFGEKYSSTILMASAAIALMLPWLHYLAPAFPAVGYLGETGSISRSLGFLIAASPCALMLGAPAAYLSALSACARNGVLVKGGARTLEIAAQIDHIVFDKTGTLTTGELELVGASTFQAAGGNQTQSTVDEWALVAGASLEQHAVHPIATALLREAESRKLALAKVTNTRSYPGQGMEGIVHGPSGELYVATQTAARGTGPNSRRSTVLVLLHDSSVRVGSPAFVAPWTAGVEEVAAEVAAASQRGEIVAILASECGLSALFRFRDVVRSEAESALSSLKALTLRTSMLTGDHLQAARLIEKQVGGLDDVFADLKPEDKYSILSDWRDKSGKVLMVGDGVNDAPALAGATVGVAMGLSSATAVQSADVILVDEKVEQVAWFVRKSKAADVIVKQNLLFALGVMALTSIFATAGVVPLWMAVILHEGGTLAVGLNGLRLLGDNPS